MKVSINFLKIKKKKKLGILEYMEIDWNIINTKGSKGHLIIIISRYFEELFNME